VGCIRSRWIAVANVSGHAYDRNVRTWFLISKAESPADRILAGQILAGEAAAHHADLRRGRSICIFDCAAKFHGNAKSLEEFRTHGIHVNRH